MLKGLGAIKDNIKDVFDDLRVNISCFFETVERFFFWGWKLRNSYDWDHRYLVEIIHFKLKRMEKKFIKNSRCTWTERLSKGHPSGLAQKLKVAIKLSERYLNHDYSNETKHALHQEKYGEFTFKSEKGYFITRYDKTKTEEENNKAKKAFSKLMKEEDERREAERVQLFEIISKYSEHWWD